MFGMVAAYSVAKDKVGFAFLIQDVVGILDDVLFDQVAIEVAALIAHPAGNGHTEQTPLTIHSKRLNSLWGIKK